MGYRFYLTSYPLSEMVKAESLWLSWEEMVLSFCDLDLLSRKTLCFLGGLYRLQVA